MLVMISIPGERLQTCHSQRRACGPSSQSRACAERPNGMRKSNWNLLLAVWTWWLRPAETQPVGRHMN